VDPARCLSDPEAFQRLQTLFRRLRAAGTELAPPRWRSLRETFLARSAVPSEALARALGPDGVAPLLRLGLLEPAGQETLRATIRISAHRELLLLSDDDGAGRHARRDTVHTPEPASRMTARQLPLGAGGRLLDVGCGGGFFTLIAASSGLSATGVDCNARAVAMARLNAALNGLHARFLRGSVDAPLALGERFDLIVANLPFLASLLDVLPAHFGGPLGENVVAPVLRRLRLRCAEGGSAHLPLLCYDGPRDQLGRLRRLVGRSFHLLLVHGPLGEADEMLEGFYGQMLLRSPVAPDAARRARGQHLRYLRRRGVKRLGIGVLHALRTEARPVVWRLTTPQLEALDAPFVRSLLALARKVGGEGVGELRRLPLEPVPGVELHRIRGARPRWEIRLPEDDPRQPASIGEDVARAVQAVLRGRRPLTHAGPALLMQMVLRGWVWGAGWSVDWPGAARGRYAS